MRRRSKGWWEHAACAGADPELFHPEGRHGNTPYKQARTYCDRCPVIDECLEHALTAGEWDGMWGGLTVKERFAIRAELNRQAAATKSAVLG